MAVAVKSFDLVVLLVYLCGVVLLGLWVGRGRQDLKSYFLGGRSLPWWAVLGSLVATETSTATFLSVPGLAYVKGGDLRFLQLALGLIVGRCVIAVVLLPWFFRGELYTAYEVLEKRFGGATKRTASGIFLLTRNLGDGLRLYLTAIVLRELVGLSLPVCIVVIGVVTIVYTVFGGMKSVVWNDCVQFVVYMVGAVLALGFILHRLPGGLDELISFGTAHGKFHLFDFHWESADPYTFWAGLFGGVFLALGTHGTDQMMVQRYLCARNQREAARALIVSGFVVLFQFALFLFLGVALACFFARFAPTLHFRKADYVFAAFIVREMPPNVGIIGLLLASVFAAAMSTLSSSLNSSASAAVADFYVPLTRAQETSSQKLVGVSRAFTVLFGVVQILIGVAADRLSESVVADALAIASFAAGLLLGIFFLGLLSKRVGQTSALVGLLAGFVVLTAVKFVLPLFGVTIAWTWFALIGSTVTFGCGWLVGLMSLRCRE